MQLSVKEVARLLNVAEDTVYSWVNEGRIPFSRIHSQYRFGRAEILEWATARKIHLPRDFLARNQCALSPVTTVTGALDAGGVVTHVAAPDFDSALKTGVARLPLSDAIDRELLLHMTLARKELLFTVLGDGIAIPHVRNPIVLNTPHALLLLMSLEHAIPLRAVPIHFLFMLITTTVREHMHLVSRLASMLRDADVLAVLANRCPREEILASMKTAEERH